MSPASYLSVYIRFESIYLQQATQELPEKLERKEKEEEMPKQGQKHGKQCRRRSITEGTAARGGTYTSIDAAPKRRENHAREVE